MLWLRAKNGAREDLKRHVVEAKRGEKGNVVELGEERGASCTAPGLLAKPGAAMYPGRVSQNGDHRIQRCSLPVEGTHLLRQELASP